jgi:hypothetical protein
MKTIAQFIRHGITSSDDLKDALRTAMQLEFATIPPYLCAEWSVDYNNDPDNVMSMIHGVVIQEMYHFALAGNILSAIGGTPAVANASFVPSYPTNTLPGGIAQHLAIDLKPLSSAQLQVFMQIEYPEFTPIAVAPEPPTTIGAFYDTIATSLSTNKPALDPNANYVKLGTVVDQIKTVADASAAIQRIKTEGEGTPQSPDQPAVDGTQLAHYYVFKQIDKGKQLVLVDGKWGYLGQQIRFPNVFNFAKSTANPNPSVAFSQQLADLLTDLQACWTSGDAVGLDGMTQLQQLGMALIQSGVRPEFVWPTLL